MFAVSFHSEPQRLRHAASNGGNWCLQSLMRSGSFELRREFIVRAASLEYRFITQAVSALRPSSLLNH
jgi:hypothetical protein